jgi:pyrimidine operon attenuation protein/uracil phosphoribosyltransferase
MKDIKMSRSICPNTWHLLDTYENLPFGIDLQTLPKTLQKAVSVTTTPYMQKTEGYELAKGKRVGTPEERQTAATDFISKLASKIDAKLEEVRQSGANVLIPIITAEEYNSNIIPEYLAKYISNKINIPIINLTCEKQGSNTGQSLKYRAQDADLTGKKVLLVDDVITTGRTLTSAMAAVRDAGGESVMALVLGHSRAGQGIIPAFKTTKRLMEKLRLTEEEFESETGYPANQLTEAVTNYLWKIKETKKPAFNIADSETASQLERLETLANNLWTDIKNGNTDIKILKLYQDTAFKLVRYHAIYDKKDARDNDKCVLDEFL